MMYERFTPSEKVIIKRASLIPGLKSLCEAIKITMPKYYKYLRIITTSHAKIISLTGHQIGMWKRFPSIPDIENNNKDAKDYFSFYVHLLLDRGILQDSYFAHRDFKLLDPHRDIHTTGGLERILKESEENERFNDNAIQSITGDIRVDNSNGKVTVYDGISWKAL